MTAAPVFPSGGSRVVLFVIYDPRGEVDDHVLHALGTLREHATEIHAIVNGELTAEARRRLEGYVDGILVRPNAGFDIGAHKDGLAALGSRIEQFDELVLTNDTWFGPLYAWSEVFGRMDVEPADFWGLTDHPAVAADATAGRRAQPRHIQSFWIAVRGPMLRSEAWRTYWHELPYFAEYWDAVTQHEIVFTEVFERAGYRSAVAFPHDAYPVDNASIYAPELLIRDRCPVVKRRIFFHDPVFLARHAVIGRRVADAVSRTDYPVRLMWANLARTVAPRVLNANAAMLEVLTDTADDSAADVPAAPSTDRVVVVAHVRAGESGIALLSALTAVPSFALVLTSPDAAVADAVAASARVTLAGVRGVEVRVHPVDDDLEALFVACEDLLSAEVCDVIIHVHDGPGDQATNPERFRYRRAMQSLLGSPAVAGQLLDAFAAEPGLGLTYAPTSQIGVAPSERCWGDELGLVLQWRESLGLRVPLDDLAPLAPDETVWAARPAALAVWGPVFASGPHGEADPRIRRAALLRSLSSAAGEAGLHTRTVLSATQTSVGHTSLEFTLDLFASTTYGYVPEQLSFLDQADWHGETTLRAIARTYVRVQRPGVARWIGGRARWARSAAGRLRGTIRRRSRDGG